MHTQTHKDTVWNTGTCAHTFTHKHGKRLFRGAKAKHDIHLPHHIFTQRSQGKAQTAQKATLIQSHFSLSATAPINQY